LRIRSQQSSGIARASALLIKVQRCGVAKRNQKLKRPGFRLRRCPQVADHRSQDVRRCGLRSGATICLHPDGQQTEDGNQAKRSDAKGESDLDKRKRVYPPQTEYHFL